MKKVAIACLIVLCGCASPSGSHIVTGKTRTPVQASDVQLYTSPPAIFETIGLVNGKCEFLTTHGQQGATDKALARAKKEAGALGANGLLISAPSAKSSSVFIPTQYGGFESQQNSVEVSGVAIFAPN